MGKLIEGWLEPHQRNSSTAELLNGPGSVSLGGENVVASLPLLLLCGANSEIRDLGLEKLRARVPVQGSDDGVTEQETGSGPQDGFSRPPRRSSSHDTRVLALSCCTGATCRSRAAPGKPSV